MPGDSLSRTVEVDNNTDAVAIVSVYVAAANVVQGAFTFAPGHDANELSSWTSLGSDTLQLAPHTEAFDTVTTHVPQSASSGNRNAVVWVAMSASPTGGQGITLVSRVGVRMYVAVGPGGAPRSDFSLGPLTTQRSPSGKSLVVAEIHNSGKSTLDLSGNLMLAKGPDGLNAGPFVANLGPILSGGASEQVIVALNADLPRGPWRADLQVKSGRVARSSIATITFPVFNTSKTLSKTNDLRQPLVIVLSTLLVAACLAFVLSRRRPTLTKRPRLLGIRRRIPASLKSR
jgi:hypothetical protein